MGLMQKPKIKNEEIPSMFGEIDNGPKVGHQRRQWKVSTIIYTSRTHTQLTQAMRELKNSDYSFVDSVALGSRDQLCINAEVLSEGKTSGERNNLCQIKVKKKQCRLRERVDKVTSTPDVINTRVKDIEDLVKIGKSCSACPYYLSRELATNADIIFMPYNYLLDPKILKAFKIDLNNAVVILDEAHNVEKVCEEAASIHFASSDITNCINDISHVMKVMSKDDGDILEYLDDGDDVEKDFTIDDLAKLKEIMLKFETTIDSIDNVYAKVGRTFPGGKLFELLKTVDIDNISYPMVCKLIESLVTFLTQSSSGSFFGRKGIGLMKMAEVIDTAFSGVNNVGYAEYIAQMDKCYRVHVEIEAETKKKSDSEWTSTFQSKISRNPKVVNFWCFNPGFGMSHLIQRNVRSIILTSGTLAPLKPLISELAIKIDQQLENPHIIKPSQVLVKIVNVGPDKEPLNGSYDNRDNLKYLKSLGMTIQGISRVTPNGILVFFPSYPLMNKCVEVWSACEIWQSLYNIKPIFTEPRNKQDFQEAIDQYYEHVKEPKGAMFMAVLRGKVSEGLDFNDHNARAVIICGIPFPPLLDPRVVLKRKYLDTNRNSINQLQSGQEWYVLEAVRAVNQAIGRVIRHKDDYGAILLCDRRFHSNKNQLSRWIQAPLMKQSQNDTNFGATIGELAKFFRNACSTMPAPIVRELNTANIKKENTSDDVNKLPNEMVKKQIKLENSNEIYTTKTEKVNTEEYNKYVEEMKSKMKNPFGDFMGCLNQDVSVINFNNSSANEACSSSSSSLASTSSSNLPSSSTNGLKSLRINNDSQDYEGASKKRKLIMIPNANEIVPSNTKAKSEESKPLSGAANYPVKRSLFQRILPSDRKEFLDQVNEKKIFLNLKNH